MPAYLSEIIAAHRRTAAADPRALDELLERALVAPAPRPFADALSRAAERGLGVIAEVKRRSPSKGDLAPALDVGALALEYAAGGAACLSVLTDGPAFGGSPEDLSAARGATSLAVLRKDFTVSAADVVDARLMGADAVLLICAALDPDELWSFAQLARRLQLDALVEVHDEKELEAALALDTGLVGVNQRDLRTFEVDEDRAVRLAAAIPEGVVAVAESGVRDGRAAARLAEAGYQAVLVGESLIRAPDRAKALAELAGHPIGRRSTVAR
jgi:indole-3-glycerol phosphate synthase